MTDLPDVVAIGQQTVAAVLRQAGLTSTVIEVGVTLTDDDEMRRLNRDYRQSDKATNVLSFVGDSGDGPAHGGLLLLGDIVLAHGVVGGEAGAQGKSLHDHYCHLLVHGTLHLLGMDHMDENEAQTMEAREVAILADMSISNPYDLPDQRLSLDVK
ncbi:MAG: rRNA maturation RNase YbeY [Alphaproteobacteria bacterium]|nr:rRNA maturation RNase YbeY [Alphaproteobacteria bacterium]